MAASTTRRAAATSAADLSKSIERYGYSLVLPSAPQATASAATPTAQTEKLRQMMSFFQLPASADTEAREVRATASWAPVRKDVAHKRSDSGAAPDELKFRRMS